MTNNLPSLNIYAGPYMTEGEACEEIARLFYRLDSKPPADMAKLAQSIRKEVIQLERVNFARCNGVKQADGFMGWTDENEAQAEAIKRKAARAIRELVRDVIPDEHDDRVAIEFRGDPRGAPVLIHVDERQRVAAFW